MPGSTMITIRPMQTEEYPRFEKSAIRLYADESARAGRVSREDSQKWAEEETKKILSEGIETPNQLFYVIEDDSAQRLGYIWCGPDPDSKSRMFLYILDITEEHRNREVGYRALQLLEQELRARGCRSIALHVYAFNQQAVHLYKKLGYSVTDLVLRKQI